MSGNSMGDKLADLTTRKQATFSTGSERAV